MKKLMSLTVRVVAVAGLVGMAFAAGGPGAAALSGAALTVWFLA